MCARARARVCVNQYIMYVCALACFRGGGGGDVVGEILAQLPPDLRADFQRQIDAGVPPEELEEALMRLVM